MKLSNSSEGERRGLMGERFVYDQEVDRLDRLDKAKLAGKVEMVSFDCSEGGFDIRSYDDDGEEIHIEGKTTMAK